LICHAALRQLATPSALSVNLSLDSDGLVKKRIQLLNEMLNVTVADSPCKPGKPNQLKSLSHGWIDNGSKYSVKLISKGRTTHDR
jgi:hypothetical protein